jgi:hypothetical protein
MPATAMNRLDLTRRLLARVGDAPVVAVPPPGACTAGAAGGAPTEVVPR